MAWWIESKRNDKTVAFFMHKPIFILAFTAAFLLCAVGWCDDEVSADASGGAGVNGADTAASNSSLSNEGMSSDQGEADELVVQQPWDFDPYRILVWIDSDDPRINSQSIDLPLREFLDRNYSSIWRVTIADAPTSVASMARRGMGDLTFDSIAASDPIIALKRDHKDAIRIRSAGDIKQYVSSVNATKGLIETVKRRGAAANNDSLDGAAEKFKPVDGDALAVQAKWADKDTEALMLTRGQALTLTEPSAKLIDLPISNLVTSAIEKYDKIFIVSIKRGQTPGRVDAIEFNTLMQFFAKPVSEEFLNTSEVADAVGRALSIAFSPELRIDDAGLKGARGLLRAGGLILDDESPARVREGDVLLPMVRKNDRNGRPILIGPLDWAFLLAVRLQGEIGSIEGNNIMLEQGLRDGAAVGTILVVQSKKKKGKMTESRIRIEKVDRDSATCMLISGPPPAAGDEFAEDMNTSVRMDYYSGRAGGLQGRQNDRTFRRALLVRPRGNETLIRLHAKGDPNFPLIGYELYEKELFSTKMTFIGRTDWNGRLNVPVTEDPLRLMYVKNGGAVLARLPIVPGYEPYAVADLSGDDMRLQAEAYVNGVANAIIDLVAIRKLLGRPHSQSSEERASQRSQRTSNRFARSADERDSQWRFGKEASLFLESRRQSQRQRDAKKSTTCFLPRVKCWIHRSRRETFGKSKKILFEPNPTAVSCLTIPSTLTPSIHRSIKYP